MIKSTKDFRAVVPGSPYPEVFSKDDELEAGSIEAKAAMDLGYLSEADAKKVLTATKRREAKERKAAKQAPENKGGED